MEVICNDNTICIGAMPEQIDAVCVCRRDMHVEEADALLQHSTSSWRLLGAKDVITRPWKNFWADQGKEWALLCRRMCLGSTTAGKGSPSSILAIFSATFLVFSLLFSLRDSSVNPLLSPLSLSLSCQSGWGIPGGEKISPSDSSVVSFLIHFSSSELLGPSLPLKWTEVF